MLKNKDNMKEISFKRIKGYVKAKTSQSSTCKVLSVFNVEEIEDVYHYRSLNDDPQFTIKPRQAFILNKPYLWLSFFFSSEEETSTAEVFFDVGEGFTQALSLSFSAVHGSLQVRFPVPVGCQALRIDPVGTAIRFSLSDIRLSADRQIGYLERQCEYSLLLGNYASDVLSISPIHELEPVSDRGLAYRATGDDPYFDVDTADIHKGWYMFSLQINVDRQGLQCAKFYFDAGEGYSESTSESLPFFSGKLVKRLIYLEAPVNGIRFDPLECAAEFSIMHFSFKKIVPFTENKYINKKLNAFGVKPEKCRKIRYEQYKKIFSPSVIRVDYDDWINNTEAGSIHSEDEMLERIAVFNGRPLFSIIMPTYNTDATYLRACIDSVLSQTYPQFELCIADDCSTEPQIKAILQHYAAQDSRVKIYLREENGHISEASNSALKLATGDFVVLLDHDDVLPSCALFYVAELLNDNPEANIIYSDEDKIDASGNRFEPHFKSGWNPDLLYAQNYVSHLGIYRRSLVTQVNGFRAGLEGSQDYDLLLRVLAVCKHQGIHHIPRVLYHWRAIEGSTALASSEKSYTTQAGIKALTDYFEGNNEKVNVTRGFIDNTYKVEWLLKDEPMVSLIMPTYNGYEITKQAIESIINKTTYKNYEIILVDNNSDDEQALNYFLDIEKHKQVTLLRYPHPFNFSAINNFAVSKAGGEIIGLVNNDIEVINKEWLTEMVSHAVRPDIGCVGAKLYYPDDTVQHGGVIMGLCGLAGHSHKHFRRSSPGYFARLIVAQNLSAVTAACLLVKRCIYEEVDGLNEKHLTIAFNDVDLCLKVQKAGYRNLWTPYAELYHHESISRGAEDNPEKQARFLSEVDYIKTCWNAEGKVDRYYNKNLTRSAVDFSLSIASEQ